MSEPTKQQIIDTINAYNNNRVPGGRDWMDYVDLTHPENFKNEEVVSRLLDEGWSPSKIEAGAAGELKQEDTRPPKKFSIDDHI